MEPTQLPCSDFIAANVLTMRLKKQKEHKNELMARLAAEEKKTEENMRMIEKLKADLFLFPSYSAKTIFCFVPADSIFARVRAALSDSIFRRHKSSFPSSLFETSTKLDYFYVKSKVFDVSNGKPIFGAQHLLRKQIKESARAGEVICFTVFALPS